MVYVNAPHITATSACFSGSVYAPYVTYTESELCFTNYGAFTEKVNQIGLMTQDSTGANSRALSHGFTPAGFKFGFANPQPTPDGKWLMFPITEANGRLDVAEIQVPPWPTPDGVNRTDFIQLTATTSNVPSGTTNALIEFGYDLNFYCTSRQDVCVAHSSTYSQATPFLYEGGDGPLSSIGGVACSSSCSAIIPVIPGHVVYYRWKYRDSSNHVISTGPNSVAAAY